MLGYLHFTVIFLGIALFISAYVSDTMAQIYGDRTNGIVLGILIISLGCYYAYSNTFEPPIEFPKPDQERSTFQVEGTIENELGAEWLKADYATKKATAQKLLDDLRKQNLFKVRIFNTKDLVPWYGALEACIDKQIKPEQKIEELALQCVQEQHQILKWLN